MKQVYINHLIEDKNFTHEFNLIDEDRTSCLFRSNGSDWSEDAKGGLALSLVDNGNGLEIIFEGEKKIKLEYYQVQELFILLLNAQFEDEIEFRESKTTMKWPL